jgi:hypothetical protein
MIAYEELEKALARWKSRRANGAEAVVAEVPTEVPPEDQPTGPAVVAAEGYHNPDNTGELDLADAEVTDA